MAIRSVLRMGHPLLREVTKEFTEAEVKDPQFQELLQDMMDTMEAEGGIGLAAPQIGVSKRMAIIDLSNASDRYPENADHPEELKGLGIYINPTWEFMDSCLQGFWEGCLSVPGLRGLVHRPRKIKVQFRDVNWNLKTIIAEDFLATVFQHEFDHLDGVLYVDRLKDIRKLAYIEEYQQFWVPKDEDDEDELND